MKYMGSKNRHAKQLLEIILTNRGGRTYVEPFVGGANVIDKVSGARIGADVNPYLIATLDAAANGWLPRNNYTEEEYRYLKDSPDSDPVLAGYFGFALSYGGKFFGGWRRDSAGKRNYVQEAYRSALKQFPLLHGIRFICSDYRSLDISAGSIIYCDPPYNNTTSYAGDDFDSEEFFDWCRQMSAVGHDVFVSEYQAPDDFEQVWSKPVKSSLTSDTGSKAAVEKLFRI